MIKGSHNSLTGHPLSGWQSFAGFLINPFCKCQDQQLIAQYNCGVKLFDLQIEESHLYGSHGVAWYDVEAYDILGELNEMAKRNNEKVYIILGLDNHWFRFRFCKDHPWRFYNLVYNVQHGSYPNLELVRAYIEKPWQVIYENKELTNDMFERYWSTSWAKSMKKHWWQFYYYLSIPKLWKRIYGRQWDKEAEESGKKFYITDFV